MPIKVLLSSAKFLRISTTGLLIHERAALHRENSCKCGIYALVLDVEPRLGVNLGFWVSEADSGRVAGDSTNCAFRANCQRSAVSGGRE